MQKKVGTILILLALFSSFVLNPMLSYAKTQEELQKELQEIERQISEQQQQLSQIKGEKQTVQTRLSQLKAEQNALKLQMRSTSLRVQDLDGKIEQTEKSIDETVQKIADLKLQLASVIREINENDHQSISVIIFANKSLSEGLDHLKELQDLSSRLAQTRKSMRGFKEELKDKQMVLESQHEESQNLLAIQGLQQSEFSSKVQEQSQVLGMTTAQEAEYEKALNNAKQRANEIRNRLYELAGGATKNVTFAEAVELAKSASAMTGVRAALLLAVLTQESNLGKNVGTCNREGDPPEKGWKVIMNPTRDQPKFLTVTQELGLNPDITPLSCPMRDRYGRQVGWGGAMGPAQFIPSTWMGYKDRVAALTGRPANPWDIRDAFLAAALLLKANGATAGGENGEWKAAMRYFSGSTNTRFRFYGDNVLALAKRYQVEIDALN